jgi:hypothetical protein
VNRNLISRRVLLTIFGTALWLAAGSFLYTKMMAFETRAGLGSLHAALWWPLASGLKLGRDERTLLVFLHPKCTCSQATVAQIVKLKERARNGFRIILAVWQPASSDGSWDSLTPLGVDQLSDYQVAWDRGGRLAGLFDAHTSGQIFIYEKDGRLVFAGGATSSRGGADEGPSLAALESLLQEKGNSYSVGLRSMPVFGCSFSRF